MSSTSLALAAVVAGALAAIYVLWWVVPALTGLPWVPTKPWRIRKALELARLRPGEILYDLGAGDGRVLDIAAREFGARAIGIEISPMHCLLAGIRIWLGRTGERAKVIRGNLYECDLSGADVVFAYLLREQAARLRRRLESHLRPGARVVAVSADFDGWEPAAFDEDGLIFMYRMPPPRGSVESFLAAAGGAALSDGYLSGSQR